MATVKILDTDAFTARTQSDEALKRKPELQDEALKATDNSLVVKGPFSIEGEGSWEAESNENSSDREPCLQASTVPKSSWYTLRTK